MLVQVKQQKVTEQTLLKKLTEYVERDMASFLMLNKVFVKISLTKMHPFHDCESQSVVTSQSGTDRCFAFSKKRSFWQST